jgi:hypothetical protein
MQCNINVIADFVRSEVLTAVKMSMLLWVATPRGLVSRYQRSALKMETACFSEIFVSAYESTEPRRTTSNVDFLFGRWNRLEVDYISLKMEAVRISETSAIKPTSTRCHDRKQVQHQCLTSEKTRNHILTLFTTQISISMCQFAF